MWISEQRLWSRIAFPVAVYWKTSFCKAVRSGVVAVASEVNGWSGASPVEASLVDVVLPSLKEGILSGSGDCGATDEVSSMIGGFGISMAGLVADNDSWEPSSTGASGVGKSPVRTINRRRVSAETRLRPNSCSRRESASSACKSFSASGSLRRSHRAQAPVRAEPAGHVEWLEYSGLQGTVPVGEVLEEIMIPLVGLRLAQTTGTFEEKIEQLGDGQPPGGGFGVLAPLLSQKQVVALESLDAVLAQRDLTLADLNVPSVLRRPEERLRR